MNLVLNCMAGQPPPFSSSPRKGENYLAPSSRCGCRELGNLEFGGNRTLRRFSGAAQGSQPHSREGRKGARGRGRKAPESFRHIPASILPSARAKGTRFLVPNLGSRPRSASRQMWSESSWSGRTPSRPALAATLPQPLQALTSCWSCRGTSHHRPSYFPFSRD